MDQNTGPNEASHEKADDRIIRGADAIAEYIFGDRRHRRKIYYLAECSRLPIWRLGSTLCLRPATYESWIKAQESRVVPSAQCKNV
jgi:hypothetical protein